MKKIIPLIILSFLFLLFSIIIISAIGIQSQKDKFSQGETALFTIQGNIIEPIKKEQVGFFVGYTQKPVDYDIKRIGDTYYIYAILPFSEQDYSLRVSEVSFKDRNQFKKENLEFNFSVTNETRDFYVKPGFIITNENISIDVTNNLNTNLEITYSLEGVEGSMLLEHQETSTLLLTIEHIPSTLITNLSLNSPLTSYSLPAYIIKQVCEDCINFVIDQPLPDDKARLEFSIDILNETLKKGEVYVYNVLLKNTGNVESNEINLKISEDIADFLVLTDDKIESLSPDEEIQIIFEIKAIKIGEFNGSLEADSEDDSDKIEISFSIREDVTPSSIIDEVKSCGERNGKICLVGESCDGNIGFASDGPCCLGVCKSSLDGNEKGKSNTTAIVVIGIILLIILVFIGWRMKKSKKPKTSKEILKEKEESFSI